MTGNGYHLLYRIDLAADDAGLVKTVLAALADRFSDYAVAVDRAVHNPARIVKVVGTVSREGDALRGIAGVGIDHIGATKHSRRPSSSPPCPRSAYGP